MSEDKTYSHLYSEICDTNNSLQEKILENLAKEPLDYKKRAEEIDRKLGGKPILLDNPENKRIRKVVSNPRKTTHSNIINRTIRKADDVEILQSLTYEALLPLHRLWTGYIKDLIGITQRSNLGNALIRADYHGSFLKVIQSKCPSLVGKAGIIVKETMNTFIMLHPDNKTYTIPKKASVFYCSIDLDEGGRKVEWHLFGDQIRQQSGIRSSKKFKSKSNVTL